MSLPLPGVGSRVSISGNIGTICYTGLVAGTQGTWLGIDWDDPSRGKHDGVHNGTRYFSCRIPGSGSFVRPSAAGLYYGQTFMNALAAKYIEVPHSSGDTKETVMLGSSKGRIEVEAVGLDKVRNRLAKLDRLKEVSLDGEGVSSAGEETEIRGQCPNIRHLDLSKNLFPSWDVIALITRQLELLESLSLNQNRFAELDGPAAFPGAFQSLKELMLNETLVTWEQVVFLEPCLPSLQHLQLGYNRLTTLSAAARALSQKIFGNLEVVNLDGNALFDWPSVVQTLDNVPRLQRLVLSANKISTIPFPLDSAKSYLASLRHLSLSANSILTWSSIDAINIWLPHLVSMSMVGNPIMEGPDAKYSRLLLIARLSSVTLLNGTPIAKEERNDAERYYLSDIVKASPNASEDERIKSHPRWKELCALHGSPDPPATGTSRPDVLSSRVIEVRLHRCNTAPSSSLTIPDASPSIRILPSMPLKALRMKALRTLGLGPRQSAQMYAVSQGELGIVIEQMEGDASEVGTWGLETGSSVVVVPEA